MKTRLEMSKKAPIIKTMQLWLLSVSQCAAHCLPYILEVD